MAVIRASNFKLRISGSVTKNILCFEAFMAKWELWFKGRNITQAVSAVS